MVNRTRKINRSIVEIAVPHQKYRNGGRTMASIEADKRKRISRCQNGSETSNGESITASYSRHYKLPLQTFQHLLDGPRIDHVFFFGPTAAGNRDAIFE